MEVQFLLGAPTKLSSDLLMVRSAADNRVMVRVRFPLGAPNSIMGVGVGTQGGLITLSAVDDRSRQGSNPWAPTNIIMLS